VLFSGGGGIIIETKISFGFNTVELGPVKKFSNGIFRSPSGPITTPIALYISKEGIVSAEGAALQTLPPIEALF